MMEAFLLETIEENYLLLGLFLPQLQVIQQYSKHMLSEWHCWKAMEENWTSILVISDCKELVKNINKGSEE